MSSGVEHGGRSVEPARSAETSSFGAHSLAGGQPEVTGVYTRPSVQPSSEQQSVALPRQKRASRHPIPDPRPRPEIENLPSGGIPAEPKVSESQPSGEAHAEPESPQTPSILRQPESEAHQVFRGNVRERRRVADLTGDQQTATQALRAAASRVKMLDPEARLELTGLLLDHMLDDDEQSRNAGKKFLQVVDLREGHAEPLRGMVGNVLKNLDATKYPGGKTGAVLDAVTTVARYLPHDKQAGRELMGEWLGFIDNFPNEAKKDMILRDAAWIFTQPGVPRDMLTEGSREWRNGAIITVYNRRSDLTYAQVGELFGISMSAVTQVIRSAEEAGEHIVRRYEQPGDLGLESLKMADLEGERLLDTDVKRRLLLRQIAEHPGNDMTQLLDALRGVVGSKPTMVRHLRYLKEAGLIDAARDQYVFRYSLTEDAKKQLEQGM